MPDALRWPFRIVLYVMLYIGWSIVALLILAIFPTMTYFEATNVLPAGWITIAAAFFADLYLTQIRRERKHQKPKTEMLEGS